jgi:preprotein translocase subunit SecG
MMMYTVITILIIIVCALLGAVVLIQNPKGGGLNASFGGVGQQLLGARRSTDVVEKLTWGFAVALIVLCLATAFFVDKKAVNKATPEVSDIEKMEKTKTPFNGNIQPQTQGAQPAQGQQTPPPAGQPK